MKKILFVIVLCLLTSVSAFADTNGDSSCTITRYTIPVVQQHSRIILQVDWVADSGDGSFAGCTILHASYGHTGWYLYTVETDPGSPAPTDNYDIIITDDRGVDLAGGTLANRDTSTTELVNIGTAAHGYPVIRSNVTIGITGNTQTSAVGRIYLTFIAN